MKLSWPGLCLISGIILLLSSCRIAPAIQDYFYPPKPGDVLFQDTFSDESSGWTTGGKNGTQAAYHDGGLRIIIQQPQTDYWSRPGVDLKDVKIDLLAKKMTGPDDNQFGVICRYVNENNFYAFLISSDGYYGIMKVKDGHYQLISAPKMQYSEAIHSGGATNHIHAECVGSQLGLMVNYIALVAVDDSDFSTGDVGIIAGTNKSPGVDVLFDDFVVLKP
jgi:hypothetical protein